MQLYQITNHMVRRIDVQLVELFLVPHVAPSSAQPQPFGDDVSVVPAQKEICPVFWGCRVCRRQVRPAPAEHHLKCRTDKGR